MSNSPSLIDQHTALYEHLIAEREISAKLQAEVDQMAAQAATLREALGRNRQGYQNILEFGQITSGAWGTRDGYGKRYGALTREELEEVISGIESALARTPAKSLEAYRHNVLEEVETAAMEKANRISLKSSVTNAANELRVFAQDIRRMTGETVAKTVAIGFMGKERKKSQTCSNCDQMAADKQMLRKALEQALKAYCGSFETREEIRAVLVSTPAQALDNINLHYKARIAELENTLGFALEVIGQGAKATGIEKLVAVLGVNQIISCTPADSLAEYRRKVLEKAVEVADKAATECLAHVRCKKSCEHAECTEQRSMANACRNISADIRCLAGEK